jgi:hypothetical protein
MEPCTGVHLSTGGSALSRHREVQRKILPIPDRPYTAPITYDADDPDTSFAPIEPLRPQERPQIAMARQ